MLKQFALRLKSLREEQEWSQRELSNILGVAPGTIGNYESGKRMPELNILIKIAYLFDCSTDYLLGMTTIPKSGRKK